MTVGTKLQRKVQKASGVADFTFHDARREPESIRLLIHYLISSGLWTYFLVQMVRTALRVDDAASERFSRASPSRVAALSPSQVGMRTCTMPLLPLDHPEP